MAEPLLAVEGLDVSYGPVAAVRGLALSVNRGEIVGLIGPNGAGKTTTLHALMGLQAAQAGEVRLDGRPLRGLRPEAIARLGLALVPEGRRIYADFTVAENLRLGLIGRSDRPGAEEDLAWIDELFPVVREFRERPAGALSGGQQQQLAIARALAAGPKVLLLDEPSLGLAPRVVAQIGEALRTVNERGCALLLVEQSTALALRVSDHAYLLETGRVRAHAPTGELLADGRVRASYLGTSAVPVS
jgi:branched-chain amino acid transport system ATP-binding protein